jgi:opacity protein-like surface antigen
MKRIILAATAALALTTSASALDITVRQLPTNMFVLGSSAHIINIPEPVGIVEREHRDLAISRWTEHCHPVAHADAYGVRRLTYAHPGCEFGEGE